jgi:hypothetical protein
LSTWVGSTDNTSTTHTTVSVGFNGSCDAPEAPQMSLTVAAIATREPCGFPTRPSMSTLKNWFSCMVTWVGLPCWALLKSCLPSLPWTRVMSSIAFLFAITGCP